jgi:hypothetical protein
MVERDEVHPRRAVARVLAFNSESHSITMLISRRRISCADPGAAVDWVLHGGVVDGEDVGPIDILSGGWGAFVLPLEMPDPARAQSCEVALQFSLEGNFGIEELGWFRFNPRATGFVSGLHRGNERAGEVGDE